MNVEGYIRLSARVQGRVQGVGFRAFVVQHAGNLGLVGWVRNTSDGDVEMTVEGPRTSVETLLTLVEDGPRSAHVINVQRNWQPATGEFDRFEILRTV